MKNLLGIIFGVLVGIAATLLLTLNLWGSEWYKTITAVAVGVLIGLFIVNPKETWVMIKKSFKKKNPDIKQKELLVRFVGITISGLFYLLLYCIPLSIGIFLAYQTGKHYQGEEIPDLPVLMLVLFFLITAGITIGLAISSWTASKWSASHVHKVWGEKYQSEGIPTLISQNILDNGQIYTIKKYVLSAILDFITKFTLGLINAFIIISAIILGVLFFFLLSVPLFIIFFIKNITKQGWSLVTSTSIVIGGLVGTIFESYILGFGFGIVSLMMFYLVYVLPEKIGEIDYSLSIFNDDALFEKTAIKLGLMKG